jgi:hypothetical protein
MSGAELIAAERERQITEEGWMAAHDDGHNHGELARAAAVYASPHAIYVKSSPPAWRNEAPWPSVAFLNLWPHDWVYKGQSKTDGTGLSWEVTTCDRSDRIRELVKAGAMIAAEIDRLARV